MLVGIHQHTYQHSQQTLWTTVSAASSHLPVATQAQAVHITLKEAGVVGALERAQAANPRAKFVVVCALAHMCAGGCAEGALRGGGTDAVASSLSHTHTHTHTQTLCLASTYQMGA
jgi:hypothetical protein